MQAAAGCLTAAVGAGAGLTVWSVGVDDRLRRFEQSPDWSVLYAELPLMVLGGTAAALGLWALIHRVLIRRARIRRARIGRARIGRARIGRVTSRR